MATFSSVAQETHSLRTVMFAGQSINLKETINFTVSLAVDDSVKRLTYMVKVF